MTDWTRAQAFAIHEAILSGGLDHSLCALSAAIRQRQAALERPAESLPPGQVWVWMNARPGRWEARGTGVVLDE